MKNVKKKSLMFLVMMLILVSLFSVNGIVAKAATSDDTGTYNWTENDQTTSVLYGMTHQLIHGTTAATNSTVGVGLQQVNLFSMKTDGVNSKIVNWIIENGNAGYGRATLADIARDYERNHPGWIVLGGINADQYFQYYGTALGQNGSDKFVPSPYYPLIIDGENRFAYTATGNSSGNYVGFTNDGSTSSIIPASTLSGFVLEVIDENANVLKSFPVSGFNKNPNSGETTVWTSYIEGSVSNYVNVEASSTNDLYVVSDAELAYMNNTTHYANYKGAQAVDSFFGRGTISYVRNEMLISKGKFAIDSANSEVKSALSEGTRIRVQARYTSEAMNKAETGAGYHLVHRLNGVDATDNGGSYNTRAYPRSLFGRKADGTYVLITSDHNVTKGGDYYGLNFYGANAMLKHYGIVEAYQDDGGGSVTAICRNEEGGFTLLNNPTDGYGARSILNGLFFVARDVSFAKKDVSTSSVTFYNDNEILDGELVSANVHINNATYPLVEGSVKVDGLTKGQQYDYYFTYTIKVDGKEYSSRTGIFKVTTDFVLIGSNLALKTAYTNKALFYQSAPLANGELLSASVVIDDGIKEVAFANGEALVTGLVKGVEYSYYFKYSYEFENETYNITTDPLKFSTPLFEVPEIEEFKIVSNTANSITIRYKIVDEDKQATEYYVEYGSEKYDLNALSGRATIENLKPGEYELKLIVKFGESSEIESEVLNQKLEQAPASSGCSFGIYYITCFAAMGALILLINKRK